MKIHKDTTIRIIVYLAFIALFTIKRDGYFPFPQSLGSDWSNYIAIFYVILCALLLVVFTFPGFFTKRLSFKTPEIFKQRGTYVVFLLACVCITSFFYWYYDRTYPLYSNVNLLILGIFTLISILSILFLFLDWPEQNQALLIFLITFMLAAIPLLYFPLTAHISDLMPIIDKQLYALMHGENIYQYFTLDNGVSTQAVRQPGTTLSYLPAYALSLDIRVMSVAYIMILAGVMIKFVQTISKKSLQVSIFLVGVFLLWPYRLLRHDLYEPFFWLLLVGVFLLMYKKRYVSASIIWGLALFTQVWSWLFSPFLYLYVIRQKDISKNIKILFCTVSLALGAGLLLLFILPNPQAYYEHVFGYYRSLIEEGFIAQTSIYLTPLLIVNNVGQWNLVIQLLITGVMGLLALKYLRTLNTLILLLIWVMFFFLLFNAITWNYMYMTIVLLMLLYIIVFPTVEAERDQPESNRQPLA